MFKFVLSLIEHPVILLTGLSVGIAAGYLLPGSVASAIAFVKSKL